MAITGGKARERRPIIFDEGKVSINQSVLGDYPSDVGVEGVAIGGGSWCMGDYGVAVGGHASFNPWTDWVALGPNTNTVGLAAIAVGNLADAPAHRSIAIGSNALGSYVGGIAIGYTAVTEDITLTNSGEHSIALGYMAKSERRFSIALGYSAVAGSAVGDSCIAIGASSRATGGSTLGIAIGHLSVASAGGAIAIGHDATVTHVGSIAIGQSAASSTTREVVFMSAAYGCTRFRAVAEIAGDLDLFQFNLGSLLVNNQTDMWLLVRNSAGATTLKQVTLSAAGVVPAPGFSGLRVANNP